MRDRQAKAGGAGVRDRSCAASACARVMHAVRCGKRACGQRGAGTSFQCRRRSLNPCAAAGSLATPGLRWQSRCEGAEELSLGATSIVEEAGPPAGLGMAPASSAQWQAESSVRGVEDLLT